MIVRSNYRLQRRVQRPCMLELFYDCTTWKHLHDTNVTTCISFKLTKTTGVHTSFTLTEWIQMIFEPFSEGFGGLLQIRLHPICVLLAQNWPVWSWPRVSLGNEFALEQQSALHGHGILDWYEVWCLICCIAHPNLWKKQLVTIIDTTTLSLVQIYKNICLLRLGEINVSCLPNWSISPSWQIISKATFRSIKKVRMFHHQDRELAIICKRV